MIICLNCLYLSVNYYTAFVKTGGNPSTFRLGNRLIETSNHFIRTDRLYQQLKEAQVEQVIAEKFITWPLNAYDLEERFIICFAEDPALLASFYLDRILKEMDCSKKTALVFYNGQSRVDFTTLIPAQTRSTVTHKKITYHFMPAFDSHFTVFILEFLP